VPYRIAVAIDKNRKKWEIEQLRKEKTLKIRSKSKILVIILMGFFKKK
jgi:hypothetical protein